MTRGASVTTRIGFIVAAVVVAVLLLASAVEAAGELGADDVAVTVEVKVRGGDNLWSIAETHTAPGDDVRATIDAIRQLNRLSGSTIYAGQILDVPAD